MRSTRENCKGLLPAKSLIQNPGRFEEAQYMLEDPSSNLK